MPTTTPNFDLVIPGSGSEPANGVGAIGGLGESVEAALTEYETYTGEEEAIVGDDPPAGTPMRKKAWSISGSTTAGGTLSCPFPGADFPNGLVSIQATPGSATNDLCQTPVTTSGLGSCIVTCRDRDGTGIASLPVRINLIAYGW